jgi:tRNA1Val (adenine37-N6)-methyltransferase
MVGTFQTIAAAKHVMNDHPGIQVHEDETLEEMFQGHLTVIQKKKGYRFSMDAVLLARAAAGTAEDCVIDLGTGCGIIPLILARSGVGDNIVGVELQEALADLAQRNVEINEFADRISIRREDINDISSVYPSGSFDCVISNPPFRKRETGRVNTEHQKSIARHEIAITLNQVLEAASYLLKRRGRLHLIYPALRSIDLFHQMREIGIEPKIIQWVHGRISKPAKMVLVEGTKAGGAELQVKEPLILYDEEGNYTEALQAIYSLP